MKTCKVAIVGFGTIGSGVARLLLECGDRIARHAGQRVELVQVVDPDLTRRRNVALPPGMLTGDLSKVLGNPEIAAVVQEEAFDSLDAPVGRIGARNVPAPFSPLLEDEVMPNAAWVVGEVRRLLG